MVDLRLDPGGDVILSWTEAPGARNKILRRDEIAHIQRLADAVSLAEASGQSAAVLSTRTALSAALFELLDGPERALAQRIAKAEAERRRLDLVVRARSDDRGALCVHPATWMRWELLPFAETRRRGAPPLTVVLQLGPQDLGAPYVLETGGLRILFMAFSPHDAPPELDFEREEEELLAAIAPMAEHRRARLRVVEEGTLDDLRAALLVERFDVVHLSGHGVLTPDGPRLVMEDAFGGKRLVPPAELIDVLERAKSMPELVMVSCCHSAEVRGPVASFAAELVAAGVPNVLGWTRPVRDDLATLAASSLFEQLAAGKTPVAAAQVARDRMRRTEEGAPAPSHAWGTLHLVSGSAAGFRIDDGAAPLSERVDREEIYKFLGSHMRVLKTGFVGRRRLVQRLLRVLLRGQDLQKGGARDVAGACVFGMKGVGKSCAVGRTIERAKQHTPELGVVVLHGALDERGVLEAFQQAARADGADLAAEDMLARAEESVLQRVRRVMEHWRRRRVVMVLDDFEKNLDPSTGSPWLIKPEAAALLEALLPTCATGKPKLLITSTAEFQVPGANDRALAFMPLGAFDSAAVRKLWMRGQASNELASVSLKSWHDLAERLGRNARVLAWARALLAGKPDAELAAVAASASAALPVWAPGDEASEEKHTELARLFLRHMACEQARAAFGEPALTFVKRARVFEAAVPRKAFAALAEDLDVDLDRDLDVLASWGLLEVGECDGARIYRVSPLIEPKLDVADAARWHLAAAKAWKEMAANAASTAVRIERTQAAWEHALRGGHLEWAESLASQLDGALEHAGLYADSLRLAERHLKALPDAPYGYLWVGSAALKAGRPPSCAVEHIQKSKSLLVRALGTEEHARVAGVLRALGAALIAQGDLGAAQQALERSCSISAKIHGTEDNRDFAAALQALGCVLMQQGNLTRARHTLERSRELLVKVHGTDKHPDVAATLTALGRILLMQDDWKRARELLERSLVIREILYGADGHPDVAVTLTNLGHILLIQGDWKRARELLERSLTILVKAHGTEEHPDVAVALHTLGRVYLAQGAWKRARELLERSLAILVKVHGTEEHPDVAASKLMLGGVLMIQGDLTRSYQLLTNAYDLLRHLHGTEGHSTVAEALRLLGSVLMMRGDMRGARQALERLLALRGDIDGTKGHLADAASLRTLADLLAREGELEQAVLYYRRVMTIQERCIGTSEHCMLAETEVALGWAIARSGQQESGVELMRHGLEFLRRHMPAHPIFRTLAQKQPG
ncbi:hypothetical protein BE08_29895 [Sorangium cellulosum]|uniref:CHAT domain-containing protein n=1 Tax=Sorangium cellulosum TaxID=56 RepID=A0A150P3F9_SORCE|nr:hypothetical protein BE08_29895 [Sorangium cellulosum]